MDPHRGGHAGRSLREPLGGHGARPADGDRPGRPDRGPEHDRPGQPHRRALLLEIGNDVQTGPYVYITDQNHGYENPDEVVHVQWPNDVPVFIGDGSWLGTGVVILPGTELGRNVVVGAGAVVRGIFPDHCVIAGVPAKIVRRYVPGSGWVDGPGPRRQDRAGAGWSVPTDTSASSAKA